MKRNNCFLRISAAILMLMMLFTSLPSFAANKLDPVVQGAECPSSMSGKHEWGKWKTVKKPSCSEKGKKERKCAACGKKERRSVDKTEHSWGEWTVITEAGDFSAGVRERTCSVCGATQREDLYPEGTLKRGDRGDDVKALQEALNAAGYDCGAADGIYGKMTEAAVSALEAANGREGDGTAWPDVRKWLEPRTPGFRTSRRDLGDEETPEEEEYLTVYIVSPDGKGSGLWQVREGAPTKFPLSEKTEDGIPVTYMIETEYGCIPYKNGMALDRSMCLPVLANGYIYICYTIDPTFSVRFVYNDTTVAEYICEQGTQWNYTDPVSHYRAYPDEYIDTPFGVQPFWVVDGYVMTWEEPESGSYITPEKSYIAKPITEDTVFYGSRDCVAQWVVLEKSASVYTYTGSLQHPYANNTVKDVLKAGTEVWIIGEDFYDSMTTSSSEYIEWVLVYYEDGRTGWIPNIIIEPEERKVAHLDPNGGTVDPEIVYSLDRETFPVPVREHYKFVRWSDSAWAKNMPEHLFRAVWEPENTFTIFIAWNGRYEDGSSGYKRITVDNYSTSYSLPIPQHSDEGYIFDSWVRTSLKKPGEAEVKGSAAFTPGEPIEGDITIVPGFADKCTITFDMGVFSPRPSISVKKGSVDYSIPTPGKYGYEFTGWNVTRSQGTGKNARASRDVRAFIPGEAINTNLTLQAQYKQVIGCSITLDAGEGNTIKGTGSRTTTVMTDPQGRLSDLPNAVGSDSSMVFEGWFTKDGTPVNSARSYTFSQDTTLHAVWAHNAGVSIKK